MLSMSELLTNEIRYAAESRVMKAREYPDDAARNQDAATRLERIADDLSKLEGSGSHLWLEAACSRDSTKYSEALSFVIRSIGFRSAANTGREFLDDLSVALGAEHLDDAEST